MRTLGQISTVMGHGDSKYVTLEEQLAIFLYTSVTGLSIRHVGERFQRANGTISKCAFKLLEMTIYKLIR